MKEISMPRSPVTALVCKTDTPPTAVRQLEARTPDGRYAASRSNDLTLVRVRPRRNPTSALLAVNHGRRSMPDPMHKALGPKLIDAAYRAGQGAKRFGAGFMDTHRSTKAGQLAAAARAQESGSVMRVAGFGARIGAPFAAAQEVGSISGRRRGRKDAAKALAPMAKSGFGDGAKRFGNGFAATRDDRRAVMRNQIIRYAPDNVRALGTVAGVAANAAGVTAVTAAGAHRLGRRKGRKDMAPMVKSYRGNVFGKSAEVVRIDRWGKVNPRIPDGARHGRRLPVE